MRLTDEMKRVVLEQRLGFAATVGADGTPNLSPKGTTTVFDDEHLMFADIHSPGTVENLKRNPAIELNVVDPIVRKGYRFKGRATLHSSDDMYDRGLQVLAERGSSIPRERIRTIVIVAVDRAAAVLSPAYDAGASEAEVAATWERHAEALRQSRRREAG